MIKCSKCGTENLIGSIYCDECGDSLENLSGNIDKNEVLEQPVFQSANVTSIGIPYAADEKIDGETTENGEDDAESKLKGVHSKLTIERGNSIGTEFFLTANESNIGRWDADNGMFPDVDLDAHDPEAKVSRKHARIYLEDGEYSVEDKGSTNGTFVNRGRRLIPGTKLILNDGDEIIVGKTFLRFKVLK
jgi:pSer/pThr/pTyr-binding forkhead associated (FHA) protein